MDNIVPSRTILSMLQRSGYNIAILCSYAYGGEIIAYALRHVIGRTDWIAERQADVRL